MQLHTLDLLIAMLGQRWNVWHWPGRWRDVPIIVGLILVDLLVWAGDDRLYDGGLLPLWLIPVVTVAVYSLLTLRSRWPITIWAIMYFFSFAGILVPRYQPFTGLLLAVHAVTYHKGPREGGVALALCAIPFGIDSYTAARLYPHNNVLLQFLVFAMFWIAVAVIPWGFGRRSHLMRAQGIVDTTDALRLQRLRLARDLHDNIANDINIMIMQVEVAKSAISATDPATRDVLNVIDLVGNRAMMHLDKMLEILRSEETSMTGETAQTAGSELGLAEIPTLIADTCATTGLIVRTTVEGASGVMDPRAGHVIYRVVQEGLANAFKHGDTHAAVDVILRWTPSDLVVKVVNACRTDGQEPRRVPASFGFGLRGLAEQTQSVGGTFVSGTKSDVFEVQASIPVLFVGAARARRRQRSLWQRSPS